MLKAVNAKWWTPPSHLGSTGIPICIGIVVGVDEEHDYWKCYVGYGLGDNEKTDMLRILATGQPFGSAEAAAALFDLDPKKYRY